jgi:hypothetical protein
MRATAVMRRAWMDVASFADRGSCSRSAVHDQPNVARVDSFDALT